MSCPHILYQSLDLFGKVRRGCNGQFAMRFSLDREDIDFSIDLYGGGDFSFHLVFSGYSIEECDPFGDFIEGFLEVVPDVDKFRCSFVGGQEVLDLFGGIKHVRSIGHF